MKYNNRRIGKFRSQLEANISKSLLKNKGIKVSYESVGIKYTIPRVYFPDFTVVRQDKYVFYIETKGYLRPEDKQKMVCVKRDNPELDIRIVFGSRNTRNIAWAVKNGFPCAVGEVPKEWLKHT